MSKAYQDLRKKLSELFQLDAAAELDFGIYRILNARRVEIFEFLDSLEGQVDGILADALGSSSGETKTELEKTIASLRELGVEEENIEANKKVIALREKLAAAGSDPTALTHLIFSHLTTFFSRYYQDGDFISLRRYKKDTYAIPYEGEEVKLHWANADQYYIKSSETLRDYAFRLGPAPKGDKPDTRPTVSFKLVEADIEKDNAKAVAGQERRFVFQGAVASDSKDHLILGFAYLPLGKTEKQAALNEAAAKAILAEHAKGAFTDLAANDPTYTVKSKTRSILAKHLAEYTGRNTFDYFVHKDLGGFLRRELDFYIKNEVLHLDDLDEAPEANWNETRAKLKALRSIAAKVIRFLAQLEDFQKKLWLKKKFVTACDYVVTLDRIPEELYPEIAACDAQREEWVRLFAIDEIEGDLGSMGYSVPLTIQFLRENQYLPVDTKNVNLSNLNWINYANVRNICIKGSNFHALNLLQSWGNMRIDCIYTDPPYNTSEASLLYKNEYRHSTWLSMLQQVLLSSKKLMASDAVLAIAIDDFENENLSKCLENIFSAKGRLGTLVVEIKPSGRTNDRFFATSHEYYHFFAHLDSAAQVCLFPLSEETKLLYSEGDDLGQHKWRDFLRTGGYSTPEERPNSYYPIYYNPESEDASLEPKVGYIEVLPIDSQGKKRVWRKTPPSFFEHLKSGEIQFDKKKNGEWKVLLIDRIKEGYRPKSVWTGSKYDAASHGTKLLKKLFGECDFGFPKSLPATRDALYCVIGNNPDALVLDYFSGSGTTGHAVIDLNREDQASGEDSSGERNYILIEMGEHFDTVLVPRLKKVIYSSDWKDGKPQNRNSGISHCFKILRLESYEDTLNNLRLHRSRAQELALEAMSPEAREDYRLGYMLDLEASGSQSLLNVSAFTDPWNYTMEIATGTAGETKTTKVDLVETFNWLLGLTVLAQGGGADKKSGGVQWVEGTNPEGDKVLVLWRNTTAVDADALNDWCKKQKVSVLDGEFGLIYINGDHHLENLRREDQTWKVRLTDEEFPKLMWEGCE